MYHYRVVSKDAAGNAMTSYDYNFQTAPSGGTQVSSYETGFGSFQNLFAPAQNPDLTISYSVKGEAAGSGWKFFGDPRPTAAYNEAID